LLKTIGFLASPRTALFSLRTVVVQKEARVGWHVWCVVGALLGCVLVAPGMVSAQTQSSCVRLYKGKQWQPASDCFAALAKKLGAAASLKPEERVKKGRYLRNAAMLLRRAAKKADKDKQVGIASFLRARAIKLLSLYLDEKLHESLARRKSAQLMQHQIRAAIGFATLTVVVSGGTGGALTIKGFRFVHKQTIGATWSRSLRPGTYSLTFVSKSGVPFRKSVRLAPRKAQVVTLSLPAVPRPVRPRPVDRRVRPRPVERRVARRMPPRRIPVPKPAPASSGTRVAGLVLLGTGGAAVLGGGVGLLLAYVVFPGQLSDLETRFLRGESFGVEDTVKASDLQDSQEAAMIVGFALVGGGLLLAAVGGVVLAVAPPSSSGKVAAMPAPHTPTMTLLQRQ
jgi:hypothetical protein